ncbi:MAG: hypothetical protein ACM3PW_00240 [Chlamydiota bacterium]
MAVIKVPRPKNVFDPDRPASSLLLAQVEHLQKAELNLPLKYCSKRYTKAITTEGEAAAYIQEVTGAIQRAHKEAAAKRKRRPDRGKKRLTIAASAAPSLRGRTKKGPAKRRRKSK